MALRSQIAPRSSAHKPKTPRPLKNVKPPRNNDRLVQDIAGILCICLGLIMWAGLIFYSESGQFGHILTESLRIAFGVGSYLVPLVFVYTGLVLIIGTDFPQRLEIGIGVTLIVLSVLAWLHYAHTTGADQFDSANLNAYGGYVGAGICALLRHGLGVASWLVYVAVIVGSLVWILDRRLLHMLGETVQAGKRIAESIAGTMRSLLENRTDKQIEPVRAPRLPRLRLAKGAANVQPDDELATVPTVVTQIAPIVRGTQLPARPKGSANQPELHWDRLGEAVDHVNKEYLLPSVDLLKPPPPMVKKPDGVIAEKQQILMQCLNDFKIGANVQQVAVGPTVTRYEVQLEPGILVKKIVALADNLAMSLAAIDVRVEAPIPGKSAIGIEVPNEHTQIVTIRECLETTDFLNAPSKLTFALGKDVAGLYKYADLSNMPHLLICGSTNSGKSVCLNALIVSIVYRATPREVKFVMIDPKRVELSLYDGIPHLLTPVVKDTSRAAGILRSVLKEMDKRYETFAQMGTRNLEGYNNKVGPADRLPFIVVIVDELADLMMTQGAEVETSICRLAQLARATGIHLVIATQRPSVDVITGTIKANIASRIAFAVATQIDSRTIIDMPGADRLIGRGDMLFLPIDASKPVRIQGCFVGEKETEDLVKYLKSQEEPVYTMVATDNASGYTDDDDGDDGGANDDLYEACVRWIVSQREASTSSLQRKFKIGYTRAARIVDTMEARGIVGPMDGVKRREVMVAPENLELLFGGKQQGIIEGMND